MCCDLTGLGLKKVLPLRRSKEKNDGLLPAVILRENKNSTNG